MKFFKLALLLAFISSTIATEHCVPSDEMKYVVFNGENCINGGFNGRVCEEYSNSGVLEVKKEKAGVYVVYFEQPYTNNNYPVLTTSNLEATGGAFSAIGGNDDSQNGYYGVSEYYVRIDTRILSQNVQADSDYIVVVAKPQFGPNWHSVVFDGMDCNPGTECGIMSKTKVDKVKQVSAGLYEVQFGKSERPGTMYAILASSNVLGTGGVITSIGGNTKDETSTEGVHTTHFQVDSRRMTDNSRSPSDYISVGAGTTDSSKNFVVFDGTDCAEHGDFGKKCKIYQQGGVKEVTFMSKGQYKIYFNNDMSNKNYVVLCDSNVWGPGGTVCGISGNNKGANNHGVTPEYVEIETRQMSNNARAPSDYISVVAFE